MRLRTSVTRTCAASLCTYVQFPRLRHQQFLVLLHARAHSDLVMMAGVNPVKEVRRQEMERPADFREAIIGRPGVGTGGSRAVAHTGKEPHSGAQ